MPRLSNSMISDLELLLPTPVPRPIFRTGKIMYCKLVIISRKRYKIET